VRPRIAAAWRRRAAAALAWAAVACVATSNAPRPIALSVEQGAPHTVVGRLSGFNDSREYVFDGRAGQRLTVEVEGAGGIRGTVVAPSGAQEGGPGGVIYDGVLAESGTYRLRVNESPMGEGWSGTFRVTITQRSP
jgi:hypothetical protein